MDIGLTVDLMGFCQLVGGGSRPWGCGNTDTRMGGIVHSVEALQERIAQDEVET